MRRRRVAETSDEEALRTGIVEAWVHPEEVDRLAAAVEAVHVNLADLEEPDLQEVADVLRVLADDESVPHLALWWLWLAQHARRLDLEVADVLVPALAAQVATSRRRTACRSWADAHHLPTTVAAERFGLGWC